MVCVLGPGGGGVTVFLFLSDLYSFCRVCPLFCFFLLFIFLGFGWGIQALLGSLQRGPAGGPCGPPSTAPSPAQTA